LLNPSVFGIERTICCHRAGLSGTKIPNSLAAIDECLSVGVPRLEIDVRFLADDSVVVFHDASLEPATTGVGAIDTFTRESLDTIVHHTDGITGLCYLEEVVDHFAGFNTLLQVDLKPLGHLSDARLRKLEELLSPIADRVLVGSQGHWNLRRLRGLPVALDPALQWRYEPHRGLPGTPQTLSTRGLWDDSPLATSPFVTAPEYIQSRVDDLIGLLPTAIEWMVDIETILHLQALGVNLGEPLAERGVQLSAWTLQSQHGDPQPVLAALFAAGVATVITDIPLAVATAASRVGVAAA
jgi:glycerophosphoryl diester phosphodiesterase